MKYAVPTMRASMTLLPETNAPKFVSSRTNRLHIVLGPIPQRVAILDGHTLVETCVGVAFQVREAKKPYSILDRVNTY